MMFLRFLKLNLDIWRSISFRLLMKVHLLLINKGHWRKLKKDSSSMGDHFWPLKMGVVKNRRGILYYGSLKLSASHKWFDELSKLIKWFLHADSDWIISDLIANLLCIFDIFWVFTAVSLVKNDVLLLVPTGKGSELGLPKSF